MEENTEISKSNKIKIIVITALIFLVSIAGISYAYFTIQVVGNETASSMRLRTANMSLVYNDVQIVSGEYAQPGWTDTKTLTVTNTGNVSANYIIKFRELLNTVINGELVLSATCSASSGTCDALPERAVHAASSEITNAYMYGPYTIAPGVTHTYTLTVLFKETGSNQNYNQNKEFYGTLNIGDGSPTDESCFTRSGASLTAYNCTDTDIIIPKTVGGTTITTLASNAFNNKGLTSVVIQNGIATINGSAFRNNQLTSIVVPDSVTLINSNAFQDNDITSVVIPSSVSSVAYASFYGNSLMSAKLPNTITSIGNLSFYNNKLTQIIIPSSVTTIDTNAFAQNQFTSVIIAGKTSSSDFTTYSPGWTWAAQANRACTVTNNTSNVSGGCITWLGN